MKLNKLVTYQIVCQEMNMTKAGKILNMSQPAVSQVIREIENHYKVSLFERVSGKLYLTYSGKKLLEYTNEIMIVHDKIEEGMEKLITDKVIRFGITPTSGKVIVNNVIKKYSTNDTRIRCNMDSKTVIEKMLSKADIDIAIFEGKKNINEVDSEKIISHNLCIIISAENPLSNKKWISLEELLKENIILREQGNGIRITVEEYIDLRKCNIVGEFSDEESIINAVRDNLGVAFISRTTKVAKGLTTVELKNFELEYGIYIAYLKGKELDSSLYEFIEYLKNSIEKHYKKI